MKVLVVQNIAGIAGSENYFISLLPALSVHLVQCSFLNIYRRKDKEVALEFSELLRERGIEVFELEVESYFTTSPAREILSLWKDHHFNLVHSHLIYADFWTSIAKRKSKGKLKMISTLHGYHEQRYVNYCLKPEKLPRGIYFYLARYALSAADGIYACSKGLKDFYERSGVMKPGRIDVILHGFAYPEFVEPLSLKGNPKLVVAGRVIRRKGHKFLLNILPRLVQKFSNLHLTIVGSGESEEELKSLVAQHQMENHVTFTGYKNNVRDYLNAADLAVVPSYAEGLPLVIFEAFSVGKPVIAFDTIGCNEAITNKETGLLASAFDEDDLYEKIATALEKPELLKVLGNAGKNSLETTFSEERMASETAAYYHRILGR